MDPPQQARPEPTAEEFNQPSEERVQLLQQLQSELGDVPKYYWAACQVCDIEQLKTLVQISQLNSNVLLVAAHCARDMMTTWNQTNKGRVTELESSPIEHTNVFDSSSPNESTDVDDDKPAAGKRRLSGQTVGTPPAKRPRVSGALSQSARENAFKWDGGICVITKQPMVEAAHVYPFYLLKADTNTPNRRSTFWQMLGNFWSSKKIAAWRADILPDDQGEGLESCLNLITLDRSAHALWNKGLFALKPISLSDDKRTLQLQFFWQAEHERIQPMMSLTETPPSTQGLECAGPNYARLVKTSAHNAVGVKSGDVISLTTDDPDALPLPSFALLEMQWHLQRIMGMAGAAELEGSDSDGDGSEEDVYDAEDVWVAR